MAAPRKKKLDYFPLDSDFFSDKKIKVVLARYGADGVTLYLYIICEIYKNSYYIKVDEDFYYIASQDLNMSSDKVKQVLKFLLKRSLFDDKLFQSDAVLTSTGIQKRYQDAVSGRAKKNSIVIEKYWLLKQEDTQPYLKVTLFNDYSEKNNSNSGKNSSNSGEISTKQKKEEKKREEERRKEETPGSGLSDVFRLFEHCGFSITGYAAEELPALVEEYSAGWVMEAIRRSADRGRKSMGYIKGILGSWKTAGAMDGAKPEKAARPGWDDL